MYWFLKCYYGYKNRWDELLFFGVLAWIKKNTNVTHLMIEVGDKWWMSQRCSRHQNIIQDIWITYELVETSDTYVLPKDSGYFFGGWEVVNDQDTYILPSHPTIKQRMIWFLSHFFTRSWWNYYISYRNVVRKWQFFLLWGIGKPYKYTTKFLYKHFLSKANTIVSRDATSQHIASQYNKNSLLHNDFSNYAIDLFRQKKENLPSIIDPDAYILINAQSHARSEETIAKILSFVAQHPNKTPIYFPCDYTDDMKYFTLLQEKIVGLQIYDWTQYSVYETLALFANASAGIGSRLHFLYPLHSFGKSYTTTTTKDKVAKLLSPSPIHAV